MARRSRRAQRRGGQAPHTEYGIASRAPHTEYGIASRARGRGRWHGRAGAAASRTPVRPGAGWRGNRRCPGARRVATAAAASGRVREGVRVRACVRPTGVLPPPGLNPDPRGARQPKWLRWRVGEWRQDELSAHDWRWPRALQGCVLCMRGVTRRLGVDSASRPSAQPICGHETRSAAQVEQTSRSTGAHVLREGAGLTGGGAQPHLMPGPSQPGGQLAGAASGRKTRPHALRQAWKIWQRRHDWLAARRPARWSKDTSSKSNDRLEILSTPLNETAQFRLTL